MDEEWQVFCTQCECSFGRQRKIDTLAQKRLFIVEGRIWRSAFQFIGIHIMYIYSNQDSFHIYKTEASNATRVNQEWKTKITTFHLFVKQQPEKLRNCSSQI